MNKDRALFVQIDLQNLFYAAKNKGRRIDFEKVWANFSGRGAEFLTEAIIYMIRSNEFDSSKFEAKLQTMGYSLRTRETDRADRSARGYKQVNHDILITIECLDRINTFDKYILMSGDGDFAELCKYLKSKNKEIEIWSFREVYNTDLDPYVDKLQFIEDTFYYRKPRITVFGFNTGRQDEIS